MPCFRRVALEVADGILEKKHAIEVGRFGSLSIVGLPPTKETMVEGTTEDGKEEKRDEIRGDFCRAGEGRPIGWRLIASDRKLVPAQDVGPIVANHDEKGGWRGDVRSMLSFG
jgi:hypothetical protein